MISPYYYIISLGRGENLSTWKQMSSLGQRWDQDPQQQQKQGKKEQMPFKTPFCPWAWRHILEEEKEWALPTALPPWPAACENRGCKGPSSGTGQHHFKKHVGLTSREKQRCFLLIPIYVCRTFFLSNYTIDTLYNIISYRPR